MLQRIQSIFLLLAVAALVATFFVPVATFNAGDVNAVFTNYGWVSAKGILLKGYPLYIGVGVLCALLLVTMFMFKNRKRQILFCRLSYLLILVQFALYFFLPDAGVSALVETGTVSQSAGFFMPLVSIGCIFLAESFIKKDERLVRSADRLR